MIFIPKSSTAQGHSIYIFHCSICRWCQKLSQQNITGIPWCFVIHWVDQTFSCVQYIPRNMHTVFALLCFVVVIHWLIFPYPSGLLHWHCGNLTIAPVPAKQPWWIWINTSCEFIMNDCITTTKQSTTKPCAYFLGYTVLANFIALSTLLCSENQELSWCQLCHHPWTLRFSLP